VKEMKPQVRVLGIDDSPFKFSDSKSLVIGALVRLPGYLEAVMKTEVQIDGSDATDSLAQMISVSRYKEQIKAVMIDGIALAGFNVVDIESLHESTDIPVITVTRDKPAMDEIRSALKKHFDDWEERFELLSRIRLRKVTTAHNPLYASGIGLGWDDISQLVKSSTVRGVVPEPVRIAHLISAAMVRGESRGRA